MKITIEFEAGSDYQKDVGGMMLKNIVLQTAQFIKEKHKKNKIDVKIEGFDDWSKKDE